MCIFEPLYLLVGRCIFILTKNSVKIFSAIKNCTFLAQLITSELYVQRTVIAFAFIFYFYEVRLYVANV